MAASNIPTSVNEGDVKSSMSVGTHAKGHMSRVVDRGRRAVLGVLAGITMAVSSPVMAQTDGSVTVVAQAMASNPEYDRIIAEAEKIGVKDMLEYIDGLNLTFAQKRVIKKYYAEKAAIERRTREQGIDQAAIERRTREQGIDQAAIEDGKRIAGKEQAAIERRTREQGIDQATIKSIRELNQTWIAYIRTLEPIKKKKGKLEQQDIERLKTIFNDKEVSPEVQKLILEKFGDIFDFKSLIAQA